LKVEQNISRLEYLLALYNITPDSLLTMVNEGHKKPITKEDIFTKNIHLDHLMRVDKFFDKGYNYYISPGYAECTRESSIFFRKSKFGCELNFGAKRVVNYFEEFKTSLATIAEHADLRLKRTLPIYNLQHNPRAVAQQLRKSLAPNLDISPKKLLNIFIDKLAVHNILVFEFLEAWNKKQKANIDGFFLEPNVLVVKKLPTASNKQIFVLIHELGHYLLNEEEVEQLDVENIINSQLTPIERWCNDFAYYFLSTEYDRLIEGINFDSDNDYHPLTRFYLSKHCYK